MSYYLKNPVFPLSDESAGAVLTASGERVPYADGIFTAAQLTDALLAAGLFDTPQLFGRVVRDLSEYLNSRSNPNRDFFSEREEFDLWHFPYFMLAWIDHELIDWMKGEAAANGNWTESIEIDPSDEIDRLIKEAQNRFAHENQACCRPGGGCGANCVPGETRLYAYGDNEESPIPLCLACFHRMLAMYGEIRSRGTPWSYGRGYLIAGQWLDAEIANPQPLPATAEGSAE